MSTTTIAALQLTADRGWKAILAQLAELQPLRQQMDAERKKCEHHPSEARRDEAQAAYRACLAQQMQVTQDDPEAKMTALQQQSTLLWEQVLMEEDKLRDWTGMLQRLRALEEKERTLALHLGQLRANYKARLQEQWQLFQEYKEPAPISWEPLPLGGPPAPPLPPPFMQRTLEEKRKDIVLVDGKLDTAATLINWGILHPTGTMTDSDEWCRFCGARVALRWCRTQGWKLCQRHYNRYRRKTLVFPSAKPETREAALVARPSDNTEELTIRSLLRRALNEKPTPTDEDENEDETIL